MSTSKTLDPEVQAILESVASDPRCELLRVPKLTVPSMQATAVSKREPFLKRAERRLLEVHRIDISQLLLDHVRSAVIAGERAEGRLLNYATANLRSEAPEPAAMIRRSRERLARKATLQECPDEVTLLERCVQSSPGKRPETSSLALAALRLVPRVDTKICLGIALGQEGRESEGLEVLYSVIDGEPSQMMLSYAWQNVALLRERLDPGRVALDAVRSAACTVEKRGDPAMRWFASALQLGDPAEALRASVYVEEALPPSHRSIEEFIQMRRELDADCGWEGNGRLRTAFSSIETRLPEQTWRIGHDLSQIS